MTWYAVSVTLIESPVVDSVLTQAQLLKIVPIFVSLLVWLTRILFIAALAVMGSRLLPFWQPRSAVTDSAETPPRRRPVRERQTTDSPRVRPRRDPSRNGQP